MIRMLRGHSFITYTVWAILIVASVAAFVLGDLMIGAVGLATLALSFAPAFMAERWHLKIPVYFYSGIVLFLFGTVFLGEAFNFTSDSGGGICSCTAPRPWGSGSSASS